MSNYSNPSKVMAAITASDSIEAIRSGNRAKILAAANCCPPLDEATAKEMGIKINCSWGELLVLIVHASGQLNAAFQGNQNFFTVKLPEAPADKRADWEQFITNKINKYLRESVEYFCLHLDRWKCLSLNGVANMRWPKTDCWLPRFTALGDMRIPTDTTIDYRNLDSFAIKQDYTVFELLDAAFSDNKNNHWDKRSVATILEHYKPMNTVEASSNYDFETNIEKFVELRKQGGGWADSDALPTIPLYHFFFKDKDRNGVVGWYMRIVPQQGGVRGNEPDKFLWTSDKPFAKSWKELIHTQFGDLSADTPAKYHSVRGLGFILYEPTFWTDITRNRMLQHLHDQFNVWFRNSDPGNKARAQIQEFGNNAVVSPGLSIVPEAERHQVDGNLIDRALAQLKQLTVEASSSNTQQADTGTQKEQTAFETRVKLEQVNALMGAVLTMAFKFEAGADREICRRFCLKKSSDPDIIDFQAAVKRYEIPIEWLDIRLWEVEPVTPLGWGNPTIAQAASQQLMEIRPMLSAASQNKVLHKHVLTITKNPREAADLVPLDVPTQSDATREAIGLFATLLIAAPGSVPPPQNNYVDQIEVLLPLLAGKIMMYTKRNNMANAEEAQGLMNVVQYISQAIQALSQDKTARDKVKRYGDDIGKLTNEIKGLAQRGAQAAAKAQGGENGNGAAHAELQSKLRADQVTARAKADATKATAAQKMHMAEMSFTAQQRRDDARTHAEIERGAIKTEAEVKNSRLKALASKPKKPTT